MQMSKSYLGAESRCSVLGVRASCRNHHWPRAGISLDHDHGRADLPSSLSSPSSPSSCLLRLRALLEGARGSSGSGSGVGVSSLTTPSWIAGFFLSLAEGGLLLTWSTGVCGSVPGRCGGESDIRLVWWVCRACPLASIPLQCVVASSCSTNGEFRLGFWMVHRSLPRQIRPRGVKGNEQLVSGWMADESRVHYVLLEAKRC